VVAAAMLPVMTVPLRGRLAIEVAGAGEPTDADEETPRVPLTRVPYVRWLAITALCSVLVTTLVDYQFKVELQQRYPSPDALAWFLGLFYTATNLAALTMQLFVTRWALRAL